MSQNVDYIYITGEGVSYYWWKFSVGEQSQDANIWEEKAMAASFRTHWSII